MISMAVEFSVVFSANEQSGSTIYLANCPKRIEDNESIIILIVSSVSDRSRSKASLEELNSLLPIVTGGKMLSFISRFSL